MAKIYEFPVKKQLNPEVEECLYEIASAYIRTLNYALHEFSSNDPDDKELTEIRELVELSYAMGLYKAIDDMEDEL